MAEKLRIEIDLEGAEQVERELAGIGKAGEKAFADIAKAADFEQATKSISALGKTAQEALDGAAEAAKKFGASTQQFGQVESTIRALGARSRDSSKSFQELAQNYDRARTTVSATGREITAVATTLSQLPARTRPVAIEIATLTQTMQALRTAGFALRPALSELGVQTGILSGVLRAGFGREGAIGLAAGGLGALAIAFESAAGKAELLQQRLSDALRNQQQGRQVFQQLQQDARQSGATIETLADQYLRLTRLIEAQQTFKVIVPPGAQLPGFAPQQQVEPFLNALREAGKAGKETQETIGKAIDAMLSSFERLRAAGQPLQLTGEAFRQIDRLAPSVARALQDALGGMGQSAESFAKQLDKAPIALNRLLQSTNRIQSEAGQTSTEFKTLAQSTEELTAAWTNLRAVVAQKTGFDVVTGSIDLITRSLNALTDQIPGAVEGWKKIGAAVQEFDAGIRGRQQFWDQVFESMVSGWNSVTEAIGNTIRKLLEFGQATPERAVLQESFGGGMAAGGLVGGRGTGTSDSNLAWLSRGEFVMRSDAVRRWGVDFMRAINAGLTPFPTRGFAAGGLVGSSSNVTINFPGLPPISGLRASTDTVAELQRAAAMAQVRSGGRKPSRYS